MRYLLHLVVVSVVMLALAAAASAKLHGKADTSGAAAGYVVVLKDDVANVDAVVDRLSAVTGAGSTYRYYTALKGFSTTLTATQADALRTNPNVQFVAPNEPVSMVGATKPIAAGETVPPGIRRIESAVRGRIRNASSAKVAIIDTGIDLNHTDLNAKNGKDCIDPEPAQDDNGHGTHVSGTVAAKNQGAGVAGVSPGTTLYAVKVLDANGSGSFASVVCGIDWVARNGPRLGIKVANMSLGGGGSDDGNCGNTNGDAMHKAVCGLVNAGITLVVAAGNSTANFSSFVPAAYDETLAVTAMADTDGKPGGSGPVPSCFGGNLDDKYGSFSNFATPASADANHTAAAPGVCVLSTKLGGGTTVLSGTSMASPHVTGTVANCIGHPGLPGPCNGLTPAQIVQKIRSDAAAKAASYGFNGDPNHAPPAGRYYGFLVSNLGY